MHVIEPRRVSKEPPAWQMFCRSLSGDLVEPVSSEQHATSDAARRDPTAKAWGDYIAGMGDEAVQALCWANARDEKLDMPKAVIDEYRKSKGMAPLKKG